MLDEASAPGIVAFFTTLTQVHGKTVLAISHDSKAKQSDNRAENVYGHRLLIDRAAAVIRVDKSGADAIQISWPKVRLGREPESLIYDRDPDTLWLSGGQVQQARVEKKARETIESIGGYDDIFG